MNRRLLNWIILESVFFILVEFLSRKNSYDLQEAIGSVNSIVQAPIAAQILFLITKIWEIYSNFLLLPFFD